jgi:cysteine desulfurase
MNTPFIYLDNASITPIDPRVQKEISRVSKASIGNPSSLHRAGVAAKKILDVSRTTVAKALHAHADEIVFTGSGTEANNISLLGVVEAAHIKYGKKYSDMHIIVSSIEHASIREPARILSEKGVRVSELPVDIDGVILLAELKKIITKNTLLISIMMANNEIGIIEPISSVVKIARDVRKKSKQGVYPLVHTDACQAVLYTEINLEKCGIDLLTIDSHKVYGPRGIGALYIRRTVQFDTAISPIQFGGGQENSARPGTENVPAIAGFAKALEIADVERVKETKRLTVLRDYFVTSLQKIEKIKVNIHGAYTLGDSTARLANNINVSFDTQVDHEFLSLELDAQGILCSTKSSCLQDEDESYVLRALAKNSPKMAKNSLRFTLGRYTTKKDIDYTTQMITKLLTKY